jgi:RNA polymerase sigma factor (sigma-70 family)
VANAQLGTVLQQLRKLASTGEGNAASDGELLDRFAKQRDEAAFVTLLKRHGPMVLHVCRRIARHEQDTEDAFQATFLLLAGKPGSIRKQASLASWLHGVAYRLALAARGKEARRQICERRAADMRRTSATPEAAWQELQTILDEALQQVSPRYREPLLLCYLQGKTQEEAARHLGCPLGTVRSRLARGRARLKQLLERHGVHLSTSALAAALLANDAPAAVPAILVHNTARAAFGYAAGTIPAALVSERVAALLQRGLQIMATTKLKTAAIFMVALGMIGAGVTSLATQGLASPQAVHAHSQNELADPPAEKMPASEAKSGPANIAPKPGDDASGKEMTVQGRVLDHQDRPVAEAKLLVPQGDQNVVTLGYSDPNGRFIIKLPLGMEECDVVAYRQGHGVDWIHLPAPTATPEITLRLPRDVPITGRVLNTEGKPIPGVSVSLMSLSVPADERLDDYLAGWLKNLRDGVSSPRKRLNMPLASIGGPATTDKEGRFGLHGAGAERIALVRFCGAGIAQTTPYVVTRPGLDPGPYNDVLRRKEYEQLRMNRFLGMYGPSFTFVAEPGKSIEGMVKDQATGKPIPHCGLTARIGFSDSVSTRSDANGKYRIEGLPDNALGNGVLASMAATRGYLDRRVRVTNADAPSPLRLDIELVKGAIVTGRVLDKQTGQGVRSNIRFAPLPDNKYFGSKPGYDNYRSERWSVATDKEGRFHQVTIPGKTLVMAQAWGETNLHGETVNPYRRAIPDPGYPGMFQYEGDMDSWIISTAGGQEFLATESAVQIIDVKETGETAVEIMVDRGTTAQIAVQDTDGKPLSGAWVAGLTHNWPITYQLPKPTATVLALNPAKPRTLVLYHPANNLGGTVTIRGDEKEAVIVKLAPVGKVTGRLLDTDGTPLDGAHVTINPRGEIASELYRFARPGGSSTIADAQGRFTITGVIPGMPFALQIQRGEGSFGGKPRIGMRQLTPGQSLDLGDRTVQPLE